MKYEEKFPDSKINNIEVIGKLFSWSKNESNSQYSGLILGCYYDEDSYLMVLLSDPRVVWVSSIGTVKNWIRDGDLVIAPEGTQVTLTQE